MRASRNALAQGARELGLRLLFSAGCVYGWEGCGKKENGKRIACANARQGLKRMRKNEEQQANRECKRPAGAKARVPIARPAARLKSCPDTSCPFRGVFPQPVKPTFILRSLRHATQRVPRSCSDTRLPAGCVFPQPVKPCPFKAERRQDTVRVLKKRRLSEKMLQGPRLQCRSEAGRSRRLRRPDELCAAGNRDWLYWELVHPREKCCIKTPAAGPVT